MHVSITVLVENVSENPLLGAEHGFACRIDTGDRQILFDTGQSSLIADNARILGVNLADVGSILLSHGHYDHCGGIASVVVGEKRNIRIYLHPDALNRKFHCGASGVREIGIPVPCLEALKEPHVELIKNIDSIETDSGIFLSGRIPRVYSEETTDEGFRLDQECQRIDQLADDQAAFFETPSGTVVLLGCAHSGLINTLWRIAEITRSKRFHTVIGGMHLRAATNERIAWTVEKLKEFSVGELRPAHCTGGNAVEAFMAAFSQKCRPCHAGDVMTF